LYDQLVQIDDSPVIALNRAVAIAEGSLSTSGDRSGRGCSEQPAVGIQRPALRVLAEFESQFDDLLAAASLDSIIARRAIQKGEKVLSTLFGSRN
jgi:predicted RNA polymerase sigma factor